MNNNQEVTNKRSLGQRKHDCLIVGCKEKGRIIGRLGKSLLTYCPKHRKKGERILNYLVNSLMRYRLTKFLQDSKDQLFKKNEPRLSDESYAKLKTFVNNMIIKLEEMEQLQSLDELDMNQSEDFDDDDNS